MNTATLSPRIRAPFRIQPLQATLGAQVMDLGLSRPPSDSDFVRLHEVHRARHVLVDSWVIPG